jgi:hypothetical protein
MTHRTGASMPPELADAPAMGTWSTSTTFGALLTHPCLCGTAECSLGE